MFCQSPVWGIPFSDDTSPSINKISWWSAHCQKCVLNYHMGFYVGLDSLSLCSMAFIPQKDPGLLWHGMIPKPSYLKLIMWETWEPRPEEIVPIINRYELSSFCLSKIVSKMWCQFSRKAMTFRCHQHLPQSRVTSQPQDLLLCYRWHETWSFLGRNSFYFCWLLLSIFTNVLELFKLCELRLKLSNYLKFL